MKTATGQQSDYERVKEKCLKINQMTTGLSLIFTDRSVHHDIRKGKVISERDEWNMINRVTQHFQETSAPAWGGAESKELNHPCVNASTLTIPTFPDNTFPEQKQPDIFNILLLIGIKLCDLVGITVLNNRLECNFDCDVSSSPLIDAIGAIPHMDASKCNFNTSSVGLGEFDISECDLDVVFPAMITIENEIKYDNGSLTPHSQTYTQTPHLTALTVPNELDSCFDTEVQACQLYVLNMDAYNTSIDYTKQMFLMEVMLQYKSFSAIIVQNLDLMLIIIEMLLMEYLVCF